jgi:NAD(P)-dependent dehydrogenase (short-subunit alcohol dehydrogenase family)
MASEGAAVVVADLNRPEAERIAGELDTAVAVEVDVADEESVAQMVKTAVASFGGLDVLHDNATDSSLDAVDTDIVTLDMAVFDRLVAVNLKGQFLSCKHAIPSMLARGGGSIVNTASIDGFVGRHHAGTCSGSLLPEARSRARRRWWHSAREFEMTAGDK